MNLDQHDPHADLKSIMREIDVVPESMSIVKILQLMQHKHVQMVAVADEYGGTAGLVTMEDLLEEIVGDIQDEHDTEMPESTRCPMGPMCLTAWSFWTKSRRRWASSLMILRKIPLAGTSLASRPSAVVGDSVDERGNRFEVLDSSGFRVLRVRVIPLKKDKKEETVHDE